MRNVYVQTGQNKFMRAIVKHKHEKFTETVKETSAFYKSQGIFINRSAKDKSQVPPKFAKKSKANNKGIGNSKEMGKLSSEEYIMGMANHNRYVSVVSKMGHPSSMIKSMGKKKAKDDDGWSKAGKSRKKRGKKGKGKGKGKSEENHKQIVNAVVDKFASAVFLDIVEDINAGECAKEAQKWWERLKSRRFFKDVTWRSKHIFF